jgi:hypothetical protein
MQQIIASLSQKYGFSETETMTNIKMIFPTLLPNQYYVNRMIFFVKIYSWRLFAMTPSVEDEESILDMTAVMLGRLGYQIIPTKKPD